MADFFPFSLFRNVLHDELNYKSYIFLWRNVSNIQWQYHIQARHRTKKVITPHAMPIIKGSLCPRNIKHDEFFQAEVASLLFADRWDCPLSRWCVQIKFHGDVFFFPSYRLRKGRDEGSMAVYELKLRFSDVTGHSCRNPAICSIPFSLFVFISSNQQRVTGKGNSTIK